MRSTLWIVATSALIMVGCAVGPNYKPADVPQVDCSGLLPDTRPASDESQEAISAETLAQWWQTLNDPLLTSLIRDGLEGSLDLKGARASIREAHARLCVARAGLFPQLDASGLYKRNRTSANMTPQVDQPNPVKSAITRVLPYAVLGALNNTQGTGGGILLSSLGSVLSGGSSGGTASAPLEGNYYQAGFDATWEIDIFGGTRRSVEAATATLEAQKESLQSVWVSLAAEIALNYIDVRTYQQRLQVAREDLESQTQTLELLESRLKAGLSDELAVQQARYNLERTRSTIPPLRTGLESAMNTLAVLTGMMPGKLHERLSKIAPIPTGTFKTVTGIPANVLRQRPDIRMAERELAAQTARIGEATAELYPKFYLFGSIGWESLEESTFMSTHSLTWNFGPRVSWPIFHSGSILGNIEAQDALQEQLLSTYQKTILTAAKEVRDALMAYAQEQKRRESLAAAVEAAQAAVEVAQDKYRNGLTDFNNVLDAQRSLLSFHDALAASEGAVTTNLVRLYKALGGGWQPISPPSADHLEEPETTGSIPG